MGRPFSATLGQYWTTNVTLCASLRRVRDHHPMFVEFTEKSEKIGPNLQGKGRDAHLSFKVDGYGPMDSYGFSKWQASEPPWAGHFCGPWPHKNKATQKVSRLEQTLGHAYVHMISNLMYIGRWYGGMYTFFALVVRTWKSCGTYVFILRILVHDPDIICTYLHAYATWAFSMNEELALAAFKTSTEIWYGFGCLVSL